ncbi:MAG: PIN domain-containing protein [Candidatus Hydrogenedentota bacterium]
MPESSHATCFIDTNVWLYAFIDGQDDRKRRTAGELIQTNRPVISTQVINEICINLLRQTAISETEIRDLIGSFYARYVVLESSREVVAQASRLRERYSLSYWDSLIVANALQSGAPILYSEDMHDGLVIEERLEIRNPFANRE